MFLPRCTVGWSKVCDCEFIWSYLLLEKNVDNLDFGTNREGSDESVQTHSLVKVISFLKGEFMNMR